MSSGSTCTAVGCHNNSRKLKNLSETFCLEHQQLRKACPYLRPYTLHIILRKEDRKLAWLAALRLKYPLKRVYVCSFHFVDKKPTELHPDMELYLGYDQPPPKKRTKLLRATVTQTAVSASSSSINVNKNVKCGYGELNCNFNVFLSHTVNHVWA